MKTYKNVKSYLKAMRHLADKQEVANMRGFNKLSWRVKDALYVLIADIQNDISEIETLINNT